ncbi:MAG: hypothetical protein QMD96_08925 [Anaerosomatales bacterium]|nr:hypothetical protein [Anaerosomatales bacterium]
MLDPRLYILGALALLSLVSVLYLVVAAVQHVARLVRARRVAASGAVALEERIDVVPEPVVPAGPPPVLESDPFRNGAPAPAGQPVERTPATPVPAPPQPAAPTEPARPPAEPAAEVMPPEPASPPGVDHPSEPLSTDQTERIAALLASLEQQAEAEVIAAERTPAAESASAQEEAVSVPPAQPVPEPAVEPVAQPGVQPPLQPAAEPVPEIAEYRLVAPVELHFTDGSSRVGVRPGTRTHDEFQRLANILLGELRRARSGFEQ